MRCSPCFDRSDDERADQFYFLSEEYDADLEVGLNMDQFQDLLPEVEHLTDAEILSQMAKMADMDEGVLLSEIKE